MSQYLGMTSSWWVVLNFIENAPLFIFETSCLIHQYISINMLADKLNVRWIINLIINVRLDVKTDSKLGHVVWVTKQSCLNQQVIEKAKSLSFRSQILMLAMSIEKK